jgi:hypothetical protein
MAPGTLVAMGQIIHMSPISYGDIDLSWMVGRRISSVSFHNPVPWVFSLGTDAAISVECLWRIIERERLVLTSEEHLHQYGLPAPIDAEAKARGLLVTPITNVRLREATGDVTIDFEGGCLLEVIPQFTGYESWQMSTPSGRSYVAMGGRFSTWLSDQGKR